MCESYAQLIPDLLFVSAEIVASAEKGGRLVKLTQQGRY